MATVLEVCTTEKRSFVVRLCGQKDSMQSMFMKKCLLYTVGSVRRLKRFTIGWQIFVDDEAVETKVRKWLRRRSKKLLCCWFRRTGKAMGQVYQCWWRICRDINIFFRFEYHIFYVLYPFVTYLLTLRHT
jgi:hypothetical protein